MMRRKGYRLTLSSHSIYFIMGLKLFDGELNDINGVTPIFIRILGKSFQIDRNIQAKTGVLILNTYALILTL